MSDALPGEGPEVKRQRSPRLYAALDQAREDAKHTGRIPWVLARRDHGRWVVVVELDYLLPLASLLAPFPTEEPTPCAPPPSSLS